VKIDLPGFNVLRFIYTSEKTLTAEMFYADIVAKTKRVFFSHCLKNMHRHFAFKFNSSNLTQTENASLRKPTKNDTFIQVFTFLEILQISFSFHKTNFLGQCLNATFTKSVTVVKMIKNVELVLRGEKERREREKRRDREIERKNEIMK
jgi:N12 class adenine-specific DNA methylase